jgi:hypothetical protein
MSGSADRCWSGNAPNVYTCVLEEGQTATFGVGALNFRNSGWIDVDASQDGVRADQLRITVDQFELP